MSKLEVDVIEPQSGTTLTIGASGDAVNIASGASITDFKSTGIDDNATANALTLDSSGNLQFNSGYGSVATAYGCRAWVNFNGTGTVAIRGSGNVSSITDNGTGDYTVNLTTAMPDANYCVTSAEAGFESSTGNRDMTTQILSASTISLLTYIPSNSASTDIEQIFSAVFR